MCKLCVGGVCAYICEICMYVCVHVYMCVYKGMSVCMCTSIYVCARKMCVHIYIKAVCIRQCPCVHKLWVRVGVR